MRILLISYLVLLASGVLSQVSKYSQDEETVYQSSYLGIEYTAWVETRGNIQLQFTHFLNSKSALTAKAGYIVRENPSVSGIEAKALYSRILAGPFYIGAGGYYNGSTTESSVVFRVDNSFLQEVDVVQSRKLYGASLAAGLLIPLTESVILDMSYILTFGQVNYSPLDGFPTNATFANTRERATDLLHLSALEHTTKVRFVNLDLAILFRLN